MRAFGSDVNRKGFWPFTSDRKEATCSMSSTIVGPVLLLLLATSPPLAIKVPRGMDTCLSLNVCLQLLDTVVTATSESVKDQIVQPARFFQCPLSDAAFLSGRRNFPLVDLTPLLSAHPIGTPNAMLQPVTDVFNAHDRVAPAN
jgi:hypothetical protein